MARSRAMGRVNNVVATSLPLGHKTSAQRGCKPALMCGLHDKVDANLHPRVGCKQPGCKPALACGLHDNLAANLHMCVGCN